MFKRFINLGPSDIIQSLNISQLAIPWIIINKVTYSLSALTLSSFVLFSKFSRKTKRKAFVALEVDSCILIMFLLA